MRVTFSSSFISETLIAWHASVLAGECDCLDLGWAYMPVTVEKWDVILKIYKN